ncbi:MAG: helix-turn-helix domain-containing protein [Clostridiales bacterium]|nr:helix-turn-helix domain-containing protein [Butyricicoccus pullicaecorum]MCI6719687.1 helix-turn-helix domain-containing protein [Clostridiales bacterium]
MELAERCKHLCRHITTLTGVHTTLLDLPGKIFATPPFLTDCSLGGVCCDAYTTHLYGAYEAERWDGKYIYYCPRGLVFLATPPIITGTAMEYCIVTGPIVMSNSDEDPFEDPLCDPDALAAIPRMTTAQARSLSELIAAAVGSFSLDTLPPDVDSGNQAAMLQMMYDLSSDTQSKGYPIENERQLQEHIRTGDKEAAQELLNELLVHIYSHAGNDYDRIKSRVRELLVLMSRAAIDGGADVDEIFNLCYRYEREVDTFGNVEALNRWIGAILHKFISFVFDFNDIKHQNVIFKTTAYIKEHLTDKLSLDQAAEQVYLSKSYFCRIIKDELGCTFTEYVNRLRIERSKTLLRGTGMPIAEIACAVGFDDQSYFTRIFKKQTGMAPGKYREQRSQKNR